MGLLNKAKRLVGKGKGKSNGSSDEDKDEDEEDNSRSDIEERPPGKQGSRLARLKARFGSRKEADAEPEGRGSWVNEKEGKSRSERFFSVFSGLVSLLLDLNCCFVCLRI